MSRFCSLVTLPVLTAVVLTSLSPLSVSRTMAQEQPAAIAQSIPTIDGVVDCEIMIVGGGLAGTATAYESLLAGRTVCMTDITDWVGGQISSQGTSALDEYPKQRSQLFYARGYLELRDRIQARYGELNPGQCWVSLSCFMPNDINEILVDMLADAEREGGGQLKWFPNTVVKDLSLNDAGNQIDSLVAIQHSPAPGTAPLNTDRLSKIIADAYTYNDSSRLTKTVIRFVPVAQRDEGDAESAPVDWYVVEATETGEIIALADVPYQLGLDPRTYLNPSSPVATRDPYCTQAFTYTFAMEHTEEAQTYEVPEFYKTYEPFYSWNQRDYLNTPEEYFNFVFTYRRIWSANPDTERRGHSDEPWMSPGDISMQNWGRGNDYGPGTSRDNFILTRQQLEATGQFAPDGWMGGLRTEALRKGEEIALGYFYWLVLGDTNAVMDDRLKAPDPHHRYLQGLDSPMGTGHGLSKYPYIRESRRIIGRPLSGYRSGFVVNEVDISWKDFAADPYYQQALDSENYLRLRRELAGLGATAALLEETAATDIPARQRARIFPDSIGISQYTIDFHPCMAKSPVEAPGNVERSGVRQAHGPSYPGQIPLRSLIPQNIDNLIVSGKSIAGSYIVAASYRVHAFEWAVGSGAAQTLDFALRTGVMPYELVDDLPNREPLLETLQQEIEARGTPIMFEQTSILNSDWDDWNPGW
ncbi:FAD-dependent oxidoreductase [Nodosilinea sp. LEGE 07088]|uniref:FAD-dependent oxidoreductase n=1 Tax=Nodosilinea sp. LEGE 07088 TaxID=2777968 RepID=UPI00187E7AFA|nr:FAD-dependent oxidoreductase [Nodosilinea sp. LEGE 07088]MBE9137323.1 FAD-dependent oxidoreductase [Nodosilinea sp. LEGE 07088]